MSDREIETPAPSAAHGPCLVAGVRIKYIRQLTGYVPEEVVHLLPLADGLADLSSVEYASTARPRPSPRLVKACCKGDGTLSSLVEVYGVLEESRGESLLLARSLLRTRNVATARIIT